MSPSIPAPPGSLIEDLARREAAAGAEADRLRARIEELTEELSRAEERVMRLAITREEVTRVLEEPPAPDLVPRDGGSGGKPKPASPAWTTAPTRPGQGQQRADGRPADQPPPLPRRLELHSAPRHRAHCAAPPACSDQEPGPAVLPEPTGMTTASLDELIAQLAALRQAQREDKARNHPASDARHKPRSGRPPVFPFPDRVVATVLHLRRDRFRSVCGLRGGR